MNVTSDGGATARARSRRLLIVLLVLSGVLNLCFIGGVLWARMHEPPRGPERIQQIAGELNLNPQQRAGFEQYFRLMRARAQLMRAELDPVVSEAWTEIAKPQPDQAKIDKDFEAAATKRHAFAHAATQNTLNFLATLSPDQRAKFVSLLREHRALWLQR